MTVLLTLLGAFVVVGLPGLSAVLSVHRGAERSHTAVDTLATTIAIAYAGLGLSAISLWLTASVFGMSGWTSLLAPLGIAGTVGTAAFLRKRRPSHVGVTDPPAIQSRLHRRTATLLMACAIASAALVAIPFAPYGWARADGIHRMAMTDWEKHLVMATGIAGSPVFPPPHPYIHADPRPSYYFGYHLVAAAITIVSHPSADVFAALWILTLATAAATPFVVYMLARDLCDEGPALVGAATATLLVGFDAIVLAIDTMRAAVAAWPIPGGLAGLRALIPSTHIDYWIHNLDRSFSPPIVTTMWAPHQTAATLIAIVVMHVLGPREDDPGRPRVSGVLLPGLLITSLAALSTYIALALGVGVAACAVVETWSLRRAPWRTPVFRRWMPAGLLGVLLALPVLPTVAQGSSSGLIIRLSAAGTWSNGAVFSWLFGPTQWALLLDTPAVYFFEFGVIGLLAAPILWREARGLTPSRREAAVVALAVLVLVTFVRPPIGVGNNLYARALLLVWFLLAPFAAIAAMAHRQVRWLAIAVAVCVAGSAYVQVGYLLEGTLFWATPKPAVDAIRWVNGNTPRTALVAIRPGDYENIYGFWLRRPLVLGGRRLAVLFGVDPGLYDRTSASLEDAFAQQEASAAYARFDALNADVILASRQDPPPAWAAGPCFSLAHENSEWRVILRRRSCDPLRAPRAQSRTAPSAPASDRRRAG